MCRTPRAPSASPPSCCRSTSAGCRARAVFGLYPARAENEDIIIYADESRTTELTRWVGLRQQHKQPTGRFNTALADFIGENDYVGAFAVTAGHRIEERVAAFEAANDDYSAIMLKSLADRLAEAAAEWLHLQIRTKYWGYAARDEAFTNAELIAEKYKGIRPAPGYPACPDHTAKRELFALLDAPANAGMSLTESCAMMPAAAVSGFYIGHPAAAYFAIPKIGRDQLEDWAARKRMTVRKPNTGWRHCSDMPQLMLVNFLVGATPFREFPGHINSHRTVAHAQNKLRAGALPTPGTIKVSCRAGRKADDGVASRQTKHLLTRSSKGSPNIVQRFVTVLRIESQAIFNQFHGDRWLGQLLALVRPGGAGKNDKQQKAKNWHLKNGKPGRRNDAPDSARFTRTRHKARIASETSRHKPLQ
jgi:hypothetical protein